MAGPEKPPEGQINPADVASQFMVLRTKDNRVAVQFPMKSPTDPTIEALEALKLIAIGLNFVVDTLQQQERGAEKPRIVLAPAIPKEFLLKGKLRAD
jgi:hypothetical protein